MALRLLIALLILVVPLELPGCGPFFEATEFKVGLEPEAPDQFVRGTLGILQPSYARLYQVIAYRYLMGVGLNDAERQAVLPPAPAVNSARVAGPPVNDSPETPWLAARNRVPGVQPLRSVDVYRQVKRDNYFDTYVNCNADAFRAAASTLERIRRAGKPEEWIAAQDMVFEDCSKGTKIPPPVSDSRFAPDRAYQIASAKFYMEQYDDARQDFQTIAADASSPWHDIAPYLAARCLIRKGKLAEAETELERIASDPALTRWHAAAESLLGYVRAHLNPPGRMHQIALALTKPDSQATIGKDLADYRFLFDQQVKPDSGDDLTDWILSFQAGGFGALEKWHEHPTLPWLVAALQSARPGDDAVQALMTAASQVKGDSPAYLTVNYHRVRLLPAAEARDLATQLLTTKIGTSDRNLLRAQRMRLAVDFEDFLRFAPRAVVGKPPTSLDKLDDDSAEILDRGVPLDLLKQASSSPFLPLETRNRLRRVVAVRGLVLAPTPNFDEVFRVLQTPGDAPYVQSDSYPRGVKPDDMDVYRDNWWCAGSKRNFFVETPSDATPLVASFVPTDLRERAAREREKLAGLPSGPSWLGAQTIAFAERHPEDLRVPEALYRVVRASRFGCTDEHTGDFSKRAFDLLHHRYPASEWTKKTPYWYK